jgi:trans-2,3-dihydro-3-hydroxyanthranilate isomerase
VTLELNVGVIPVTEQGNRWELRANAATSRVPEASPGELAVALGVSEHDLYGPASWVNAGSEQLIVPLASEAAVRRVKVDVPRLQAATQDGPRAQAYVFASTGPDTLLSRFFFGKGDSIAEDPATGSAAANLGGWFVANQATVPLTRTISQGEMVGRPSRLHLRIDAQRQVFVAGQVVDLGAGGIEL